MRDKIVRQKHSSYTTNLIMPVLKFVVVDWARVRRNWVDVKRCLMKIKKCHVIYNFATVENMFNFKNFNQINQPKKKHCLCHNPD